jgi:DNA-binding NarL/FixJ family response regulator
VSIRVLLADDQHLVRAGFRMILRAEPGIEVVGESEDGLAVVEAAKGLQPDVVLMDIRMPNLDGMRRLIAELSQRAQKAPPKALGELTPRELEVLRLVAGGLSNAEIAETLVVSEHTAKTHVAHILGKLGLQDRVQAVVVAYESGLVEPGSPAA